MSINEKNGVPRVAGGVSPAPQAATATAGGVLSIRGKATAQMSRRQLEVRAKYSRPEIQSIAKAELALRNAQALRIKFTAVSDRTLGNIAKCSSERLRVEAESEIERRQAVTSVPATDVAAQVPEREATTQGPAESASSNASTPTATAEGESGASEREPHQDA